MTMYTFVVQTLATLDLGYNDIRSEGAQYLILALTNNTVISWFSQTLFFSNYYLHFYDTDTHHARSHFELRN